MKTSPSCLQCWSIG